MMEWMILPLKRYIDFSGRSRRKEYWMYALLLVIVFIVAGIIDTGLGFGAASREIGPNGVSVNWGTRNGPVESILALVTLIPNLAVAVRRLHDLDKSGWWLLIAFIPLIGGIILLVWYCIDGTHGPNRFGPDPKAEFGDLRDTFR